MVLVVCPHVVCPHVMLMHDDVHPYVMPMHVMPIHDHCARTRAAIASLASPRTRSHPCAASRSISSVSAMKPILVARRATATRYTGPSCPVSCWHGGLQGIAPGRVACLVAVLSHVLLQFGVARRSALDTDRLGPQVPALTKRERLNYYEFCDPIETAPLNSTRRHGASIHVRADGEESKESEERARAVEAREREERESRHRKWIYGRVERPRYRYAPAAEGAETELSPFSELWP